MSAGSRFDLSILEAAPKIPGKPRHKTREVVVGGVPIGADNPIRVQRIPMSQYRVTKHARLTWSAIVRL